MIVPPGDPYGTGPDDPGSTHWRSEEKEKLCNQVSVIASALDKQIASHPFVFAQVLESTPHIALDPARPIIFSGIGTSLHAARIAAAWITHLTNGRTRALALDAHDVALREPLRSEDQLVVISHRGYKRYPTAALERARALGADTIAIVGADAPDQRANIVVRTCSDATAGTFSVSYLASLAALGNIASTFDRTGEFTAGLERIPQALKTTLAKPPPIDVAQRG